MSKCLEINNCTECKHFGAVDINDYDFTDACYYYAGHVIEEDLDEHIIEIKDTSLIPDYCPLEPYNTNIIPDMSRDLPDSYAEPEILCCLKELKDKGKESFDVLDIIIETHLPPEQINRILKSLIKEKAVERNDLE